MRGADMRMAMIVETIRTLVVMTRITVMVMMAATRVVMMMDVGVRCRVIVYTTDVHPRVGRLHEQQCARQQRG
jgi:hypothetical protein